MPERPYLPQDKLEGSVFINEFCNNCKRQYGCLILVKAFLGDYPKQWICDTYNFDATKFLGYNPRCKEFEFVGGKKHGV